ncbi:hypothetical protein [Ekhidna sp.]
MILPFLLKKSDNESKIVAERLKAGCNDKPRAMVTNVKQAQDAMQKSIR